MPAPPTPHPRILLSTSVYIPPRVEALCLLWESISFSRLFLSVLIKNLSFFYEYRLSSTCSQALCQELTPQLRMQRTGLAWQMDPLGVSGAQSRQWTRGKECGSMEAPQNLPWAWHRKPCLRMRGRAKARRRGKSSQGQESWGGLQGADQQSP